MVTEEWDKAAEARYTP